MEDEAGDVEDVVSLDETVVAMTSMGHVTPRMGTTMIKKLASIILLIAVPGVAGFVLAVGLTGVGMCSFVPLTWQPVAVSFAVALGTIIIAASLKRWWIAPLVITIPMLIPLVIASTSVAEEWRRVLVAVLVIMLAWIGAFIFRRRARMQESN